MGADPVRVAGSTFRIVGFVPVVRRAPPLDPDAAPAPAPWARQLAAVYPTRVDLAPDLGVCSTTLAAWLVGATGNGTSPRPNTLNRVRVGELYGSVSPIEAVEQAVVTTRQALDAVLEMRTVARAQVQAERGQAALDRLARTLRRGR